MFLHTADEVFHSLFSLAPESALRLSSLVVVPSYTRGERMLDILESSDPHGYDGSLLVHVDHPDTLCSLRQNPELVGQEALTTIVKVPAQRAVRFNGSDTVVRSEQKEPIRRVCHPHKAIMGPDKGPPDHLSGSFGFNIRSGSQLTPEEFKNRIY